MSNATSRSLSAVVVGFLSLALFTAPATAKSTPKPEPEKTSWPNKKTDGKSIGKLGGKFEASGIVWDESLQVLWIVDDAGTLGRMKSDGTATTVWDVSPVDANQKRQRLDLESVTVAGTASKIYLGVESPPTILEYNASSTEDAPTATGNKWVLENVAVTDNSGMEALTWVPNGYHPYAASTSGGLFYATLKKDGTIHAFDVDLSKSASTPADLGTFKPSDKNDISDLYFSADNRTLYVLYDNGSLLLAVDPSTKTPTVTATYSLLHNTGTKHPEGVTLLPGCPAATTTLYLADDVEGKGVRSFSDFPQACPAASAAK